VVRLILPKKVIIGPFDYEIQCNEVARASLGSDFGETDTEMCQIRINPERPDQIQREVLLHETLHACMNVACLDLELGEELEEKVVRRLTPILMTVMLRNPSWVKALVGGKNEG